ncbi:helix-turn-helix domain-containing protein [Cohnella sp. REN36]|uniref:helix-turn-helix domain-containing protein n=1 Tax=Cohnella sp. REN36 TaxID=2887347 RepID=UPI001D136B4E|nr:helix-turn-helix domain-containing protein [Cohnella sp. REN36]MCC3376873.1 helix-turn-helix domain-containing protein [Cohnella sp. REN36]
MNPLDEVLTVTEAAALLRVTPRQVQRLCKSGKLVSRYADGIYLILRQSAVDYIAKTNA